MAGQPLPLLVDDLHAKGLLVFVFMVVNVNQDLLLPSSLTGRKPQADGIGLASPDLERNVAILVSTPPAPQTNTHTHPRLAASTQANIHTHMYMHVTHTHTPHPTPRLAGFRKHTYIWNPISHVTVKPSPPQPLFPSPRETRH